MGILNDCQKYECFQSSSKRDTQDEIYCYINKVRVLILFTNNVQLRINHNFYLQNDLW